MKRSFFSLQLIAALLMLIVISVNARSIVGNRRNIHRMLSVFADTGNATAGAGGGDDDTGGVVNVKPTNTIYENLQQIPDAALLSMAIANSGLFSNIKQLLQGQRSDLQGAGGAGGQGQQTNVSQVNQTGSGTATTVYQDAGAGAGGAGGGNTFTLFAPSNDAIMRALRVYKRVQNRMNESNEQIMQDTQFQTFIARTMEYHIAKGNYSTMSIEQMAQQNAPDSNITMTNPFISPNTSISSGQAGNATNATSTTGNASSVYSLFVPSMLTQQPFVNLGENRPQVLHIIKGYFDNSKLAWMAQVNNLTQANQTTAQPATNATATNATVGNATSTPTAPPPSVRTTNFAFHENLAKQAAGWSVVYNNYVNPKVGGADAAASNVTNKSPLRYARFSTKFSNILSSNGVIHLIDRVIFMPENVSDQLQNMNLTAFADLVKFAGISDQINNMPSTTMLVPSNDAINKLVQRAQSSQQQPQQQGQQQPAAANATSPANATGAANATTTPTPSAAVSFVLDPSQQTIGNLSKQDLANIIKFNVIKSVIYSSGFNRTKMWESTEGGQITVNSTGKDVRFNVPAQQQQQPQQQPSTNATANATSPTNATAAAVAFTHHVLQDATNQTSGNQSTQGNQSSISNASLLFPDVLTTTGVIQVVDNILVPAQYAWLAGAPGAAAPMVPPVGPITQPNQTDIRKCMTLSYAEEMCDSYAALQQASNCLLSNQTSGNATSNATANATSGTAGPSTIFTIDDLTWWFEANQTGTQNQTGAGAQNQTGAGAQNQTGAGTQNQPGGAITSCPAGERVCFVMENLGQACNQFATSLKGGAAGGQNATAGQNATTAGGTNATAGSNTTAGGNATVGTSQTAQFEQQFVRTLLSRQPTTRCYNPNTHICTANNFLCPVTAPHFCSGHCYALKQYNCGDHFHLCNNQAPKRCGDACYDEKLYECVDGKQLKQKAGASTNQTASFA